jgi:N-methylhydantoinase A
MQSNGGLASVGRASNEPVRTVLSGPAGGVVGAAQVARLSGDQQIIGFDMGGTSTDVWLIEDQPRTTSEAEIAGLPVRVPMLNIHTVGAGGGSLAWFDAGGALRVGPQSAGADPGPICYGKGEEPTVTDCSLLLGRLPQHALLAGTKALDLPRTRKLTEQWLRKEGQKLSLEAFAEGVIRVVNSNMEKAIRLVSIEKGYDPRRFTLVAFGGAGALHACELAEGLEIPRVLVPFMPGALSALGILMSDVVRDHSKTLLLPPSRQIPLKELEREAADMRRTAQAELRREGWTGKIDFKSHVDLRYAGQGYEISVPLDGGSLAAFEAEHQRVYGFMFSKPVEVVTLRLSATVRMERPKLAAPKQTKVGAKLALPVQVYFNRKQHKAKYLQREALGPSPLAGLAVIGEYSATTFVPLNWTARADKAGNLILTQK